MIYLPNEAAYEPGKPRVFVPFEDRKRDLSGLLEFGTVLQIFPNHQRWQLTSQTAEEFERVTRLYFHAHDFSDLDYIVAIGDPVVIACVVKIASDQNHGRVCLLKWDRLRCPTCDRWSCSHGVFGRYEPVLVHFPVDARKAAAYLVRQKPAAPNHKEIP